MFSLNQHVAIFLSKQQLNEALENIIKLSKNVIETNFKLFLNVLHVSLKCNSCIHFLHPNLSKQTGKL